MPSDAAARPNFELKTFFDGPVRAYGLFQSRSGRVVSHFHVNILGQWNGGTGILHEYFTYLDGAPRQQRIWTLRETNRRGFEGTGHGSAEDILGTARGQSNGCSLHWAYDVALPVRGKLVKVHFDELCDKPRHSCRGRIAQTHTLFGNVPGSGVNPRGG